MDGARRRMSWELRREECKYTSCYCEENVWWMCNELIRLGVRCFAVVCSNPNRTTPVFQQRAGNEANAGLVVWDYHVFCMQCDAEGKAIRVFDLDTRLDFPQDATEYFERTFPEGPMLFLRQTFGDIFFRVVEGESYLREFSSDRSHMKLPDGKWQAPPPSYACILQDDGVNRFDEQMAISSKDHRERGSGWGTVYSLDEFRETFLYNNKHL